jgi:hypothetical protein
MATNLQKITRNADNANGRAHVIELDLAEGGFPAKLKSLDLLGMSQAAISVQCIGCTGTSGNIIGNQGNDPSPALHVAFTSAVTIATGANTNNVFIDIPLSGSHLSLDLSGLTLGSVGRMIITIVAKAG